LSVYSVVPSVIITSHHSFVSGFHVLGIRLRVSKHSANHSRHSDFCAFLRVRICQKKILRFLCSL
jgi:hypothetical protein